MNKYKVSFNGKTYFYNGSNTAEVADKFSHRKVFGNYAIMNMRLKMYDADTQGKKWAEYIGDGKTIMIEVNE